jgi:hypothetical protein
MLELVTLGLEMNRIIPYDIKFMAHKIQ